MMDELISYLMTTPYASYVTVVILVAYLLSHVIQYLPVTWTEKIPDIVMTFINLLAAKHGAEQAAKTDISGNPVE